MRQPQPLWPPSRWPPRPTALTLWGVALAVIFAQPLWALAQLARTDLHSHTLLIPLISAYLLWVERRRLPVPGPGSILPAAAFAAVACTLTAVAHASTFAPALGPEGPTSLLILALVCLLWSGGFACCGVRWMHAAAFPLAFLLFMVPLPGTVAFRLEAALEFASADVAAWFFDLADVPVLRQGNQFQLPGLTIEVARECSGLRSTYVLLMTGLVVAYLFLRGPWRRAVLVAAIIPLGLVRNGFRILVLGALCVRYGPQMIHSWIHHRGGPLFFVLSLVPMFLLLYGLWKTEHRCTAPPPTTHSSASSAPL